MRNPLYRRVANAAVLAAVVLAAAPARAADPDPMQLLTDAAKAVAATPSATADLRVRTKLVRDEKVSDQSASYVYRTAPAGRFEFMSVAEDGGPSKVGYHVVGNGEVTITALLSGKRHMLAHDEDGIAAFVRSPSAENIGSGLGGLALAFFSPAAIADVVKSITASEFVGVEEVDGEKLLHARYSVNDEFPLDVWYRADGAPLVRRVRPDVLTTPGVQQMASKYKDFEFLISFEFTNWKTDAGLTKSDIAVVEPKGSLLLASLYEPPAAAPYALLGKKAPSFRLPTPEGEEVVFDNSKVKGAVLLEFWATTCPRCVQLMPALEELHQKYAKQGLEYFAVNVNNPADEVAEFLKRRGLDPTALVDEQGDVTAAYAVNPLPLILVVGPDGRVQVAEEGGELSTPAMLDQQIGAVLRGENVVEDKLQEIRAAEARRVAELDQLRSLLDG